LHPFVPETTISLYIWSRRQWDGFYLPDISKWRKNKNDRVEVDECMDTINHILPEDDDER
jgi:hypothetical protein